MKDLILIPLILLAQDFALSNEPEKSLGLKVDSIFQDAGKCIVSVKFENRSDSPVFYYNPTSPESLGFWQFIFTDKSGAEIRAGLKFQNSSGLIKMDRLLPFEERTIKIDLKESIWCLYTKNTDGDATGFRVVYNVPIFKDYGKNVWSGMVQSDQHPYSLNVHDIFEK